MPENTKILIIDDNDDIVIMLEAMLKMKGYQVAARTNTVDLHSHLREYKPEIVLMDMLLSGSDGREVCRELKANPEFSDISLIMISAHPSAKEECLDAGSDYFLAKPFEMKDLYAKVTEAIKTD